MEAQGVEWMKANKNPGSRTNGASLFADMLEAVIEGKKKESGMPEKPAFYVFDYCRGWISRVPVLVRDSKTLMMWILSKRIMIGMLLAIVYCISLSAQHLKLT